MKTVLVYGLTNVVGGIENYLMLMQKYLQSDLQFVFLVEKVDGFIYEEDIHQNGGLIEFLPDRHQLQEYMKVFHEVLKKYSSATKTLYVNVSHISFDIIPVKIGLSEGYRVVTHSHGAGQEPIKRIRYRIRHSILRAIGNVRLKHSEVERLAVSKRAGDFLYHGKPYKVVSPGIEVSRFLYDQHVRDDIRDDCRLDNAIVLGFVGRLVTVKNPLFLVDILNHLKQVVPRAKLLIIGDGDLKEDMVARADKLGIEQDIVFVGEVGNVQDYYQAMDVLLAPSYSEGMPLNIMEAQSAGVPCICAKGNFPEAIDVTGIVHFCSLDEGPSGWSETITDVIDEKIDRINMNETVSKTIINIENASKELFEVLK